MKKFILSVMAVAALACGLSSCNNGAPKATYANGDLDTLAYAYGVMFGTQYSNFHILTSRIQALLFLRR